MASPIPCNNINKIPEKRMNRYRISFPLNLKWSNFNENIGIFETMKKEKVMEEIIRNIRDEMIWLTSCDKFSLKIRGREAKKRALPGTGNPLNVDF